MNQNTEEILKIVSDWKGSFCGAYSIRENGQSISRMSSEHIHIEPFFRKTYDHVKIQIGLSV